MYRRLRLGRLDEEMKKDTEFNGNDPSFNFVLNDFERETFNSFIPK